MKPYYYTFEWKDRVITLCLVYLDGDYIEDDESEDLHMGYAVKLPSDKDNEDFAKKISLGRALKAKTSLLVGKFEEIIDSPDFKKDKGFLKSIARICERNIKNGTIVIKGIR